MTASLKAVGSQEWAVWLRYLKRCNRRYTRQAEEAVTLGPTGKWPGSGALIFPDADDAPPADRRNLTCSSINAERGKPDLLRPVRKADRKECRWEAG